MKKKKSFSKVDYILLLLEEYKDQLTLVYCINVAIKYAISHLIVLFPSVYLRFKGTDYAHNYVQYQFGDFNEQMGYMFVGALILHGISYKQNNKWIFLGISTILFILSNGFYFLFVFEDLFVLLERLFIPFIITLIGQFIFNMIWLNEIYQLIRKK